MGRFDVLHSWTSALNSMPFPHYPSCYQLEPMATQLKSGVDNVLRWQSIRMKKSESLNDFMEHGWLLAETLIIEHYIFSL